MLFKEYHIPMIRSGSKTVTRREWDENYHGPNVGTIVAAKTDLLKPDEKCDCFIRITGKREEYLGDITEASARREGDYDGVEDFRDGYEEVYGEGSWDDDKQVTVVEFEYVGETRPASDGSEQTELVTDGGPQTAPTTADGTDMSFVAGSKKDAWRTPPALYEPIAERIGGFDLDPCAGPPPAQLELPGDEEPAEDLEPTEIAEWNVTLPTDGLTIDWYGDVWLNPPFSEKGDWLAKAVDEWQHGDADRVFIVTPDATDVAAWWHEYIAANAAVTYFVESRTNYVDPATAEAASGVSFNTAVSVFGEVPPELLRYWRDAGDLVVRPWNEGWSL